MSNNFCERFILHCNPKLTTSDLMLLDILSEKYDVFIYKDTILKCYMSDIISRIIIGLLPYEVAIKIILGPDEFPRIADVGKDNVITSIYPMNGADIPGSEYINKEIERMNTFIKLKLMDNER